MRFLSSGLHTSWVGMMGGWQGQPVFVVLSLCCATSCKAIGQCCRPRLSASPVGVVGQIPSLPLLDTFSLYAKLCILSSRQVEPGFHSVPVQGSTLGLRTPGWLASSLVSYREARPPSPGLWNGSEASGGCLIGVCLPVSCPKCVIRPFYEGSHSNPFLC